MLKIGIIGIGYWGKNILRNIVNHSDFQLVGICDILEKQVENINLENLYFTTEFKELISNPEINAVIIATPAETHFQIAFEALQQGKHVLVEKPFTLDSNEAQILVNLAKSNNLTLMIDHTYLYSDLIHSIKKLLDLDFCGDLNYYSSNRVNHSKTLPYCNVIWDLAPHDLSILKYLVPENPIHVLATSSPNQKQEQYATLQLFYKSGFIATMNYSWISPIKIRQITIVGQENGIFLDEQNEIKLNTFQIENYSSMQEIDCNSTEPLKNMLTNYYNSIKNSQKPISNGEFSKEIVQILEKAQESLKIGEKISL